MVSFNIPDAKKKRVIIDSDAKNEVDDQFAIVQALLSEGFDLRGLIAAHFGGENACQSMQASYEEILHLLDGVLLYEDCGIWEWRPAPEVDPNMKYRHTGKYRPIRVYRTIDARFILEDLYAKLELFHQGRPE